jgi:hypothetical protein
MKIGLQTCHFSTIHNIDILLFINYLCTCPSVGIDPECRLGYWRYRKETKTDILEIVFLSSSPVLDLGSDITTSENLIQTLGDIS